jgi:hypothetical protein
MHGMEASKHTNLYLTIQVNSIKKYFSPRLIVSQSKHQAQRVYSSSFLPYQSLKHNHPNLKNLGMWLLVHHNHQILIFLSSSIFFIQGE